ncbi:MAG: exosortase-associated EpsI family protein [Akkermansiaceae bacterium]|nr:exosortase-associated EpsI family protein [Akkermansiaceae bacterium]
MNLKKHLPLILPPAVLALLLCLIYILPFDAELKESAISAELPVGTTIPGWYGEKTQPSAKERGSLATDTEFSKAVYRRCYSNEASGDLLLPGQAPAANQAYCYGPQVAVSIVYSGRDMNASIHRPERCLPTQGHMELTGTDTTLQLANGKKITLRRLQSFTIPGNDTDTRIQHIHYYVFVGHDRICHSHLQRTLYDMWDRFALGRTQRWAYLQVGSYWGGDTGISEEEAEDAIQSLIAELAARQINWGIIKN